MQQQAINRAFSIIEFVAQGQESPISFNDIAKHMELNTGTCANIIKALVQRGYLDKLDEKKGYVLGKKIYQLTNGNTYKKDMVNAARPVLESLTKQFNENALIAVLKDSSRYILHLTTSNHDIQANSPVDKPAYESATGRMLIAMLPDEELERFIVKHGLPKPAQWKSATSKNMMRAAVETIRKDGYAYQESERQIIGFAVPVMQSQQAIAAISVYIPSYRLGNVDQQALIRALKKAAENISKELSS